ncbi:MAG: type II toxin-antitoxin system prevent-host-death family antitoxin [Polyangia bacterium]
MKFLSIRDLRGRSAEVWRDLAREGELVITRSGRPIAVMTSVDENSVEEALEAWRRIRAAQAVDSIQRDSMRQGTDDISMEEIDSEIKKARSRRRKRSR